MLIRLSLVKRSVMLRFCVGSLKIVYSFLPAEERNLLFLMINNFAHQLYSKFETEGEGGEVGERVEFGAGGVVGGEAFYLLFSQ